MKQIRTSELTRKSNHVMLNTFQIVSVLYRNTAIVS